MSNDTEVKDTSCLNGQELICKSPDELKPYPGNARTHDEKQITALMASISEFGFTGAIVVNEEGMVLAGHGRLEAAKRLGLKSIPTKVAAGLTENQQRAYVLADNKISQLSKWNNDQLKTEIEMLVKEDFNIEVTGFSTAEIDIMLDISHKPPVDDSEDLQPEDVIEQPVTRPGDLFILGKHKIICGSSLEQETYNQLMGDEMAQMVITDPPYNVRIDGIGGNGKIKHAEFAMASGEMNEQEFTDFLGKAFTLIKKNSENGAIVYSFMDWRHQREILNAALPVFEELRQLCVWVKDNGGMGTFYRSQHELVYVFKNGLAVHINNFELGQHGRYRTNVWNYPGVNTFKGKGFELLKLHPTVKPVSMIADAIRDCSHRKGIILDPFAGSGTILIAAEKTNRCARAIEIDPKYVDIAVRRWERVTCEFATHAETGLPFYQLAELRKAETE